jgi:hypothetical protein
MRMTVLGPLTRAHAVGEWPLLRAPDGWCRRILLKKLLAAVTRRRFTFHSESEARAMMGERRVMQEALFYGFSLERHVPNDHLLRKIDRFVDLSEVRADLEPYYSDVGRPSIDPELMIRMLIVG